MHEVSIQTGSDDRLEPEESQRKSYGTSDKDSSVESDGVRACFEVGGSKLLLIFGRHATVLNEDLKPVYTVEFWRAFGKAAELACCKPGFGGTGYLLAFNNAELPSNVKQVKTYKGSSGDSKTLVTRFFFDSDSVKFTHSSDFQDYLLITNERIASLLEYAPSQVAVSTWGARLLLFNNFECVRVYTDSNLENSNDFQSGGQLSLLPGFHLSAFPFIAWARKHSIELVNVSTNFIAPLILRNATTSHFYGQNSFLFRTEPYGMSIHYTALEE